MSLEPRTFEPATGNGRPATASQTNDSRAEPVHILIVDDRRDKLVSLEAALTDLGENIVCASSGKEALRCLLRQDFAVILLDVNMPGMDGFETAELIRRRPRSELTPIIFVSAINDNENHVSRGYSLGAVDYIGTPVIPEILRAKVSVFVDLFRKTAQIKRQAEESARLIRLEAARAEAEAARERSAFLAEASNVLAASLEYEETFATLARLIVPRLADYCIVDMVQEDGVVRQVAVAHRDKAKEDTLRELRTHYAFDPGLDYGVAKVLRTGNAEICSHVDERKLEQFSRDYNHLLKMQGLAFRSYMVVPLRARGRITGAISFISTGSLIYGAPELSLAEEVAQRAALALDNAGLYKAAQEARQEAERANRAKDQFLAMLSHELRTPLTPVLSAVALLESEEDCPAAVREALQMIHRNVDLEARLIDDLLDLTRVSKGKLQLNLETVDAHELIRSALDICHAEIHSKRLETVVLLQATQHFLRADSARLQQVFWNLIKNAVKFTPASGRLALTSYNDEHDRLHVEVADNGVGIEPELLPIIFNAFEQGARPQMGGLGLGLAITKALVQQHGGEITAHSAGLNQGATFHLILATTPAPPAASVSAQPANGENPKPAHYRLLIVEDHTDTNISLTRLLERRGHEVRSAEDIASAVEIARDYPFQILISDMGLPDGSGIDLIQKLSAERPVIGLALSGFGMEDDIRRSKEAGFSDHLTKPVDISKLETAIQRLGAQSQ